MATTNHERVNKAMELLRAGLAPFVKREVMAKAKANVVRMDTIRRFAEDPKLADKPLDDWDAAALLKLMCGRRGATCSAIRCWPARLARKTPSEQAALLESSSA